MIGWCVMKTRAEKRAALELGLMSIIWGYGFIAVVKSFAMFSPMGVAAYRFVGAVILTLPLIALSRAMRQEVTLQNFKFAAIPGIFLGLYLYLQTLGLEYTTATKSGFITTLYILWVPLLERVWLKKTLGFKHYVYVGMGLVGTALICQFHAGEWNFGDLLTLLCSFAITIQIVAISKFASQVKSPFVLNGFQSVWGMIACMTMLWVSGREGFLKYDTVGGLNFLYLIVFSSILAFTIQVRSQKVLSAGVASMIFLLESPAASFFGYVFFNERLNLTQWIGAGLILLAAVLVVRQDNG